MKKVLKIVPLLLWIGVSSVLFASCHRLSSDGRHVEQTLHRQQTEVLSYIETLRPLLESGKSDSLLQISQTHKDVVLFVYDEQSLVFWSDNRLVANNIYRIHYDDWWFGRFDNAIGIGRWTKIGRYSVCTIIPVKFVYSRYSEQLPNNFIPPFAADNRWLIRRQRANEGCYAVTDIDGKYVFSLVPPELEQDEPLQQQPAESFSFGSLFASPQKGLSRYNVLVGSILMACLIFLAAFMYTLIRSRGLKNIKIYKRVMYLVVALVLGTFVCLFYMTAKYVRTHYEERQRALQQEKAQYIQAFLQNLYYWDMNLSELNSRRLNADLRDMSYTYKTDILVYDLNGRLIGSSVPQLTESGLIARMIAAEPFFSDNATCLRYEQIGTIRYLTAYTLFYNGSMLPLGYIAVPSYISSAEVEKEMTDYIELFLPLYAILLALAFVATMLVTRYFTRNLRHMADTMRHFRLGQDNYIRYDSRDELGDLISQYNEMVKQLEESTTKLAQSERESAWRTMARQIAHEINNSLTPMKLSVQQLQRIKDTEYFNERFDRASRLLLEQFDDLGRIATTFSDFAKMPDIHPSETDIAEKLFSAITLMRMHDATIPIRYVGQEKGVMAYADAEQVTHAFTNIIKNALQALYGREKSDVIVMLKDADQQAMLRWQLPATYRWIEISISDNGPGIEESIQSKIFMPNFTTKSTGMGLGLAITKNIVDGSEGYIRFETSHKGTTFYIYFKKL